MWLFFAFATPFLWAFAMTIDGFLANRRFGHPMTLAFYASTFGNLAFLPFVFIIQRPALPSAELFPVILLLGAINVGYLYPYYKGLQEADTSIVSALFSIGRIFIPILAFFIVGEKLGVVQYAGIMLVIASCTLLSLERSLSRLRLNRAFWYIALAAFITAFEGVLYKYLFDRGVFWSTAVGGQYIASLVLVLFVLFHGATRADIAANFGVFRIALPFFAIEEAFSFLAFGSETFAISLAPVSIIKAVTMITSFCLLGYAVFFGRWFPNAFREHLDGGSVAKKVVLFFVMMVGLLLATQ